MTKDNGSLNPAAIAISAAGGRFKLAKAINPPVTRQAVEQWLAKGRIPPNRVPEVARVTGLPKKILSPLFADS